MTELDEKAQAALVKWVSKDHPGIPKTVVKAWVENINNILKMNPATVKNVAAVQLGALRLLGEALGISKIKGVQPNAGDKNLPKITFTIPGIN